MGTRRTGNMGRGKKILVWTFRIVLCVATTRAAADEPVQYATALPSARPSRALSATKHAKKTKKHRGRPSRGPTMLAGDFAPELRETAAANPTASKYFSRTVFYYRSSAPIPDTFNCDAEKETKKLKEAEIEAGLKCEESAHAGESCHLAKSVIAKTGALKCSDFPGQRCPGAGHYRGCVAEALVFGEM